MKDKIREKPVLDVNYPLTIAVVMIFVFGMGHIFPSIDTNPSRETSVSNMNQKWASPGGSNKISSAGWWPQALRHSFEEGVGAISVNAVIVDDNNNKWFSTEAGILSYDGSNWEWFDQKDSIPVQDLKDVLCLVDSGRSELWIASSRGLTVARLPLGDRGGIITYDPENSDLLSQEVLGIVVGENSTRWIGTRLGVSALSKGKWLTPDYQMHYTRNMFRDYPITSMTTSPGGDTLYVGTAGAGVARVYHDELDAISGASVIAGWGPIIIPSDNVLSVFVAVDGARWYGTDQGVARHTGDDMLDRWTVYTTDEGLLNNQVQSICEDMDGNMWFGTHAGISVWNGASWRSYTTEDGLVSHNIKCLAVDHTGVIWIGTDAGINSYEHGEFIAH